MPPTALRIPTPWVVFLLAPPLLVHASAAPPARPDPERFVVERVQAREAKPSRAATGRAIGRGTAGLPAPVIEMREAILAAVRSGRIEDLAFALEMNEMKPSFTDGPEADPIGFLKKVSSDGTGRDVLAVLGALFEASYVELPFGRDPENNRIYVWPHFAETGIEALSAEDEADLARIADAQTMPEMRAAGRYVGWKIGIGADGTWHFLTR
jgi:hypothetical protein